MEEAKRALNEFMESIGERNDEEVELQKSVDELKRELKGVEAEIATLDALIKAIDAKVGFP